MDRSLSQPLRRRSLNSTRDSSASTQPDQVTSTRFARPAHEAKMALTHHQQRGRQDWMAWMWKVGIDSLKLTQKTVELALRMVDIYCYLTSRQDSPYRAYKGKEQGYNLFRSRSSVLFGTVLFTCAKYQEVYPPTINDFMVLAAPEGTTCQEIIEQELLFGEVTDFSLAVPTLSWVYSEMTGERMPVWGIECYILFFRGDNLNEVARQMVEAEGQTRSNGMYEMALYSQATRYKLSRVSGSMQKGKRGNHKSK